MRTPMERAIKKMKEVGGVETPEGWVIPGSLNLSDMGLTELPRIKEIKSEFEISRGGHFWCNDNELTSWKGAPSEIVGNLICGGNKFITLEGCPSKIGGSFVCGGCPELVSLEGGPKKVGDEYIIRNNPKLTSLRGAPFSVPGNFICKYNKCLEIDGVPKKVGKCFWYCENLGMKNPIPLNERTWGEKAERLSWTEDDIRELCDVGEWVILSRFADL